MFKILCPFNLVHNSFVKYLNNFWHFSHFLNFVLKLIHLIWQSQNEIFIHAVAWFSIVVNLFINQMIKLKPIILFQNIAAKLSKRSEISSSKDNWSHIAISSVVRECYQFLSSTFINQPFSFLPKIQSWNWIEILHSTHHDENRYRIFEVFFF